MIRQMKKLMISCLMILCFGLSAMAGSVNIDSKTQLDQTVTEFFKLFNATEIECSIDNPQIDRRCSYIIGGNLYEIKNILNNAMLILELESGWISSAWSQFEETGIQYIVRVISSPIGNTYLISLWIDEDKDIRLEIYMKGPNHSKA